jgi:hypothetical protein
VSGLGSTLHHRVKPFSLTRDVVRQSGEIKLHYFPYCRDLFSPKTSVM